MTGQQPRLVGSQRVNSADVMERKLIRLSRRYRALLQKHLKQGPRASLHPARGLGRQAMAIGLETLEVAGIHEEALATLGASGSREGAIQRAEIFFTEAISPMEKTHRAALKASARLSQLKKRLARRAADLAASNRSLKLGIIRRRTAEEELRRSGKHYAKLLLESHHLQKHLRRLTHQILSAQEAQRKKIGRKLHDEVAQALLGINVRLLTLKEAAKGHRAKLAKDIANTQRLVQESVQSIHRLVRELDLPQQA